MTRGPLASCSMVDFNTAAIPDPFPCGFRSSNWLQAQCSSKRFIPWNNRGIMRLCKASNSNGGKRTWIFRKKDTTEWLSRLWFKGCIHDLPYGRKQWQGQDSVSHGEIRLLDNQGRSLISICKSNGGSSLQKYDSGTELQILVCKVYKILELLKLLMLNLRCSYSGLFWNEPRLLIKGPHHSRRKSIIIPRALGRVLLSSLFLAILIVRPFPRLAATAYAAPPVNVGSASQAQKDIYETLLEKFQRKDEELGRADNAIGRKIKEKLQDFHNKIQERKKRYEAARHLYEEFSKSKEEQRGKQGERSSFSPFEKRVMSILDKQLEAYRERLQDDMTTKKYISLYEERLRQTFEESLSSLEAFERESLSRPNKEAALLQKTRSLIDRIRVEGKKLQARVLKDMESTLLQLKQDKKHLTDRLRKVITKHIMVQQKLKTIDGKSEVVDKSLQDVDSEVAEVWERLLSVEARIQQKASESLQVAEKIPKLEQQYEEAISTFMKDKSIRRSIPESQEKERQEKVVSELKETLEKVWEKKFLPQAVDTQHVEPPLNEQTGKFLEKVKLEAESSKTLLERIDNMVKEDIEAEEKMKEEVVFAPNFKKWKAEKDAELKQFLQENPEVGRQYVAQKQEQILKYRDRVLVRTWYDEKHKRWMMPPEALGYAVEKKLVESARIRHDRRVMYLKLKGSDRVYYADLQLYDATFQNDGGFDALYLKMLTFGVSTSVEVMWIPFSEWQPARLFLLPFKLAFVALSDIWKSGAITPIVNMYFKSLGDVIEEFLARICLPIMERLPKRVQIAVGLQLPDNAATPDVAPFLMELKKFLQKRMEIRFGEGEGATAWWISLPFMCFILGIPLAYFSRQVGKVFDQVLGPGEEMNEVEWKEEKGKQLMKKLNAEDTKEVADPVRKAFDKMKRIKDPELSLKDFAGLDVMKDEINEIVTFLRNPTVFQEMGARPPRGVLIVGQSGTGKTSLAMAIAAEARVPMVELDGLELEGGAWVGQGASNVRELFKTAREVAPVIIFMDDFDYFAGVRGDSGDTRKQDHESLINQLLVELDGFETQDGVVLLATSSRPGNIDEALRRPGRMDRTIRLPMPNKRERELILRKAAETVMDHDLIDLVDWKEMAKKTAGMTPQQLKVVPRGLERAFMTWKHTDDEELFSIFKWLATFNSITPEWLAKSKWMRTWKSGLRDWLGLRVTKEDIDAAVECIDVFHESRPGLEFRGPGYIWTREFKFPHAVWAAGRGLVGVLLPNFDSLEQIWLDQSSWEGIGFTRFTRHTEGGYEETGTLTRSYYEKKLVLCFGSSVAARLLLPYGENNNLAKYEIQEAQEIAASMVLEYGWGPDDSQVIYASSTEDITMSLGDELENNLNASADKLFNAAFGRASDMIQKNKRVLEALVEHLLQFDAISKQDIARILKENGAIFEEEPFMLVPLGNNEVVQVTTNGTGRSTSLISATNNV